MESVKKSANRFFIKNSKGSDIKDAEAATEGKNRG